MFNNVSIALLVFCAELLATAAVAVVLHARFHAWLMRCRRGTAGTAEPTGCETADMQALAMGLVQARQDLLAAAATADAAQAELIAKQLEQVRHFTQQVTEEKLLDAAACELALVTIDKQLQQLPQQHTAPPAKPAKPAPAAEPEVYRAPHAAAEAAHAPETVSDDDIEAMAARMLQHDDAAKAAEATLA